MYVSVRDLKRYRGITTDTDDVLINEIILSAQTWIDTFTGTTFEASADTTRYFHATKDTQGRVLWLDYDLCAVTTVTNGDATTVTSGQYTTLPRNGTPWNRLRLLSSADIAWTYTDDPEDAISIAGRWGYSTTPPLDIEHACRRLAAYLYNQKDTLEQLDRPLATGDGNILLPGQIPADVLMMLRPYQRMELA